ncbi:MAG: hypothetical protein KJ630_13145 [Proteobacteria bacterium]|nr:hypothetical protein [Pseudomonadota bacterium]
MKYAFIALIACYLLVYGCGPDNSKKTEDKKGQTVHSTVEKPLQPAQSTHTVQPQEAVKQPVAAAVETPQPPQPDQQSVTEVPAQQAVTAPPAEQATEANPQQPPVAVEEQKTGEQAQELQPPCTVMGQEQNAIELTQPDSENIVIMPCGCMFLKHQVPADAPCLRQLVPPCPMMGENQPALDEELVMMPCGRVFARQVSPVDDPELEMQQQNETLSQVDGQPQMMEDAEEDLAAAIENMVMATNDMVQVTQQLVLATQEMLKATKGTASEATNPNNTDLQTEQTAQPTDQQAAGDTNNQTTVDEQKVVSAMKHAVIATQKATEAINQAAPQTLEPKQ